MVKTKHFFGKTLRDALRMVKEDLGQDALILEERPGPDGVELVAGLDEPALKSREALMASMPCDGREGGTDVMTSYESAHETWEPWMTGLQEELSGIKALLKTEGPPLANIEGIKGHPAAAMAFDALKSIGFSRPAVQLLLDQFDREMSFKDCIEQVKGDLRKRIRLTSWLPESATGVYVVWGGPGFGKTSSILKWVTQRMAWAGKEGIHLISLGDRRMGASGLIKAFQKITKVKTTFLSRMEDLQDEARCSEQEGLVLVDTPCFSWRDETLEPYLKQLACVKSYKSVLVLPSHLHEKTADRYLEHFKNKVNLEAVVLTKWDEIEEKGSALSWMLKHPLPLLGISEGPCVLKDWSRPSLNSLIEDLFDGVERKANKRECIL